ncbi:unnamed protein product [Meloidogyne enterolobii]|uniref:Uncharacterized protein n=1 Tax=Meloidogyne enterolobii TaxID=390850 RepID=A0ACB1B302_MELEN
MTFKMPELRIVSTNLCPQTTSFQKDDYPPNRGRVPAAFHLLPYYARRNELNILRELHAKLSDPQKKLHQKMMMDAILREQLAVRGYSHNSQYNSINSINSRFGFSSQNTQKPATSTGKSTNKPKQNSTAKKGQKEIKGEKSAFSSFAAVIDKINAESANGTTTVSDPPPSKEKKQRVRKRKAPAPKIPQPVSGLDLVQNFASINQKQEQGNNNIVNTVPATTTNTNFIITPTTNNSLHNFFQLNQGQTMVQNQQVIQQQHQTPPQITQQMPPQTMPTTMPTPYSFPQLNFTNTIPVNSSSNTTYNSPIPTYNSSTLNNCSPDIAKRRADFITEATSLYNNKYRMLSRSIYDFYVKRLKITQNLDPRLLLKKDLEIRSKFELVIFTEGDQQVERLVEHGKLRRKLVTIEEVFDIIHDFHNRLGHGKKMAISEAIKQDYANITLNCVLLYMANCKECYMASQLQTSTSLIETTNSDFNKELNIEDDEIIELKKVGTSKYIDYSEHFLTGQDEIRCKYCNFIYFTNSKKRPRYYLRSHLINFHKEIYNEIFANREEESVNINLEEDEEIDILNDDDGPSQNKIMRMSGDNSTTFN